jgi:biopolymer transport protein ExbD
MSHPVQTDDEPLSEVNVIPLADLSLVLLIILMVLSPMIMQSMIKVHATRATAVKSLQENPPEPPLILLINPDGVFLNTVRMNTDMDLAARLAQALGNRDDKTVLITADPAVIHGRVVQVLDLVKQQGASKIALLHKAGGSASPAAAPARHAAPKRRTK